MYKKTHLTHVYPIPFAFVFFCFIRYAGATGLICMLYSLKAATKPSKSDVKLTKIFGAFGFLGFLLGLLAVAFFTPGTRGDSADIDGGFFLQVIGLCGVLGYMLFCRWLVASIDGEAQAVGSTSG